MKNLKRFGNTETYLKQNRLKITKGRKSFIEILSLSEKAMSAEEIFNQYKNRGVDINLSTIYRNLELFEEKGIVDKFDLGDGKYNYVLKENGHTHIIQCELCHKEIEIDCPMIQIEENLKNKIGFTMMEHEIKIKGICNGCKKNEQE